MKKRLGNLNATGKLAVGFGLIILAGTFVLMLPFSSRSGSWTSFLNALFTATSATCVTGLVVVDTYQYWSLFGQLVILVLIQVGGLGFITLGAYLSVILKKKIGLKERTAIHESISTIEIAGVVRMVKRIVQGTFLFELTGAVLLSIRFIPEFGWGRGIYFGIFHSVSAFCNAGFDLMGIREAYSSLTAYEGDVLVNLTIMGLILVSGIGFLVWDDFYRNGFHYKKYLLHTKIMLAASFVLVFGGAILFYLFENNGLFAGMTLKEKALGALFCSVSPRTAGFNTTDLAGLGNASKLLTMLLMFVGGGSGSTAGGIKVTTAVVMVFTAVATIGKTQGVNIFKRRLEEDVVRRASAIVTYNGILILIVSMIILAIQPFSFTDVFMETFSAMGTVGLSTGITRQLLPVSKALLILLMYFGRLGSLTFALVFAQRRVVPPVQQPVEKIVVG
ncbi:MAG: TrkH family potassium uptake protein [Eubacteriales bacterium]|nr:TrkH family potassium uptake protein [Eubacteriales bacterium]